ncbi:MAG: AAA family ATPase, partial [Deltaproteobacteria bacterium]|nr:AAA family ATPase [Deltaproteobacteria bacterium]
MPTLRKTDRKDYLSALCRTVPYHIVEAVLASPTELAIGHQTYEGCVMYAEVVGFSSMCERLASAGSQGLSQLSQVLDRLFELLLERGVFPFGGYVIHFGGDSMAVIFYGRDAPRRCIAAAISLQQIMYSEIGRLLSDARRELMLRIGLAHGEIHLPVLGDLARRFVVCAGEAAQRALKLQQQAQPDEIMADVDTVGPLGSLVDAWEKSPGCFVVHNLNGWPEREPIAELLDRIEDNVEEKIALLEPFVPQPLAQRLRTTPHGWRIEGELREVALLHLELTFPLRDGIPAEAAINIARSLPRAMRKYDGILSKVDLGPNGHRALGIFGLTGPSENNGERAIMAALEINSRIRGFTIDRSVTVELRVGVHVGQVYFGAIGSTHKHDIAAVGDAVNIAGRTSAAAQPFEVLATSTALEPVRLKFQHSERALLNVAGADRPLKLHVMHGVATSRAHYAQRRRRRRFLAGRGSELERLLELTDLSFNGESKLVGLCGDAGTGKSALLSQIIDRWVEKGGLGVVGRCHYATQSTPLAPIVTMFANFLGFTSDDSGSYRRDRIRGMLTGFGIRHGADELVALLQPVERPDGTTEALLDLADAHARERVLDAIIGFVQQRMRQEPLLYVIEDLHYADTLTLQLARRLAAFERKAQFLAVVTYRPEPVLAELRSALDQELLLGTLEPEQATDLILHELRAEHIEPELARFLFERTQGNPQHLVEVLRFVTEREMIRVRAGSVMHVGTNLDLLNEAVPRTLAHLALARLDNLGEAERRLLRTAAAIGRRFKRNLLERVSASEMEPDLLESAIAALESHHVITADAETQPGYCFRDEVIRAVAYEMIPEQERRHVHRRIADALEKIPDAGTRGGAVALAMHRERAGQTTEAVLWFERAIQQSAALALDREVLELIARWESLQAQLGGNRQPTAERAARVGLYKLVAT